MLFPAFCFLCASSGLEGSLGLRALALSPNQRYLAVSEKAEKASVTVFDLHQEHGMKRNVLTAGDFLVQEFLSLAFSPDSKYLIGQSGAPEWLLIFWSWEKNKLLATEKTTNSNNPISQVSQSHLHSHMESWDATCGYFCFVFCLARSASVHITTCRSV